MDKPELQPADLIPLQDLDRANPMIWEGEEDAQGVFVAPGEGNDPLELLGSPSVTLPEEPRLPSDFVISPALRKVLNALQGAAHGVASGQTQRATVELTALSPGDLDAIPLMLGKGEVSGKLALDEVHYELQEAVTPGLWMVRGSDDTQWLEVAPVPEVVEQAAWMLVARAMMNLDEAIVKR